MSRSDHHQAQTYKCVMQWPPPGPNLQVCQEVATTRPQLVVSVLRSGHHQTQTCKCVKKWPPPGHNLFLSPATEHPPPLQQYTNVVTSERIAQQNCSI
ncbi:hypothetical protein RRG08_057001 [Elysia crispata]|uniref:Uncharacterized protein n=1 Tax=Elysia crispata TaxID=231223 RepID=A0AAE0Z6D5_9GAST|nr:hypothetical protein RRG08_057001 [Elysia crispata]